MHDRLFASSWAYLVVDHTQESELGVLLQQAALPDPVVRGQLLERYRARLRRLVASRIDRRLAARVDPSDVVQETLNNAFNRLTDYFADPAFSFYPWLRSIAWERLIDLYRTHVQTKKRSILKETHQVSSTGDDSVAKPAHVAATEFNPCRQLMLAEMSERLRAALDRLDPRDRAVLVRRYLKQQSVEEIAVALGMSRTAVTTRHLRALRRLKRLLGEDIR